MKLIFIKWGVVLLFLSSFCLGGLAQLPPEYLINTRHLNIQDGLSHRIVNDIHQDQNGFIWIATENGLDLYDGFEFKNWTKAEDGLSFRRVHHILEDDTGLLWLFTNREFHRKSSLYGVDVFNPRTHEHWPAAQQFDQGLPFDIAEVENYISSEKGHILFVTRKQLWEYHSKTGFVKLDAPDHFMASAYGDQLEVYGTFGDSLALFDRIKGLEIILDKEHATKSVTWMDKANLLTFDTYAFNEGDHMLAIVSFLDKKIQKVVQQPFLGPMITQVDYDPVSQQLWTIEAGRIKVFDKFGELIYNSGKENTKLLERETRTQFFDKNGDVWFGTSNGVYIMNLKKNPFQRLLYTPLRLGSNYISCRGIIETNGLLYVGSRAGKRKIDLSTGVSERLQNNLSRNEGAATHPFPLAKSHGKHIWTGTEHLIAQRASDGQEFKQFEKADDGRLWSIYEDDQQVVWLGYSDIGLHYFDLKANMEKPLPFSTPMQPKGFSKNTILHILEDVDGHLILASNNGLYIVDRMTKTIERYWSGGEGEYYLPAEKFQHSLIDSNGILWLATDGSGLIRWDIKNGKLRQFTQSDGLSNNNIYAVYEDDSGFLWLSSDYGIMRFDKQTFNVRKYFEEDGITHYEFNRISHYQDDQGHLYFGSLNGVTTIDPASLNRIASREDGNQITLIYAGVRRGGKSEFVERTKELIEKTSWSFDHDERNLVFKFKSDNYFLSDRLCFFYQMEGLDDNWIALNGNELRIHELGIGQYQLKVKAQNPDGTYSSKPFVIPLSIKKPFTYTYWFWGSILLLLGFSIWRALEWKVSRLKRKEIELEELVLSRTEKIRQQAAQVREDKRTIEQQAIELKELDKAKSRFFANISHELRTPLSLILGPLDRILRRNKIDTEDRRNLALMRQHGNQLIGRIDELLDLSRMESNQLIVHEEPEILYTLLKKQITSFRPFALQKNIQLNFDFQANPKLCIQIDGDKLKKIHGNFISNALKYVDDHSTVEIILADLGNRLRLDVRDNGPGIHPEDLPHIFERFYQAQNVNKKVLGGTGIGLSLSKELAAVMNAEIEVESEWGKGSCFSLFFNKIEVIVPQTKTGAEPSDTIELSPVKSNPDLQNRPKKATILLVEDHQDLRHFLVTELSDYEVVMACDGVEALEKLKATQALIEALDAASIDKTPPPLFSPDLIISDIMMPRMDGLELLNALKTSEEWQHIPVIMLTAKTGEKDKLQALRIGVDDYMVKPFDPEELLTRVAHLIERAQQRSEPLKEEPLEKTLPVNNAEVQQWLQKVEEFVLKQLSHPDFTLDRLAADLYISKRQLQRKLKASTGMTANHYIREIRLHQARQFIEKEEVETLSELSYAVGFTDPHYFSTLYQKRFGKKPLAAIR